MSGDKAVVRLLYRCMLRWSRRLDSLPLDLRPSHIDEIIPGVRRQLSGDTESIRNLARVGFRQHAAANSSVRLVSYMLQNATRLPCAYTLLLAM